MNISDAQIQRAIQRHGSQRKAAAALGLHSRTVERRLARIADEAIQPRVLVIDIETAPHLVWAWGLFKQNIGVPQIEKEGRVLCFAAKWHGEKETMFHSENQRGGAAGMVKAAHRLMLVADAIVGWNSQRFDTRWLNTEFKRHGLNRPAGYRNVDLMREVKKTQYHPSYSLAYNSRFLGVGGKVETGGFALWRGVMAGDRESWGLMEEYNRNDTDLTDEVLTDMREGGWLTRWPNMSILGGEVCPCCGSDRLKADGYHTTQTRRYAKWVCLDCGSPSQSVKCEPGFAKLKAVA